MGRQRIISVALAAVLASTSGCFTIAGGIIGGAGDPPAAQRKPDSGWSGGAKGVLVGAIIDVALIGAAAYSFAHMDWGLGGTWGPDHD